ncbi:MAG: phage portal protein [Caulobacterales bacterium]
MAWHALGRPAWPSRDPTMFAREGYAKNAIAYRCVRLIAEAAASAPLRVGPSDHPLAALLARPNPEQTGIELLETFFGHLQVSGNAYLEAASFEDAPPRELYALRPDRTQVLPGPDGWPIGWEHRVGPDVRRFERDPVSNEAPILHLKLFHPSDDWYGQSPMEAAAYAVDRWDRGNVIRVKLYAGALESVSEDDVLAGANVFAIEGESGEWEILAVRTCVLVGEDEYELSGLLRGLADTGHAMGAPMPAGRKIVKLDARLARLPMSSHEWDAPLGFFAPPASTPATDVFANIETLALHHVAMRPFSPAHLAARRTGTDDVTLSWVRQARSGGLAWGPGEPPIGEPSERYLIEILDPGGAVVRSVEAVTEGWLYSEADQIVDFGAPPAILRFRAAQIGANGLPGLKTESTITL